MQEFTQEPINPHTYLKSVRLNWLISIWEREKICSQSDIEDIFACYDKYLIPATPLDALKSLQNEDYFLELSKIHFTSYLNEQINIDYLDNCGFKPDKNAVLCECLDEYAIIFFNKKGSNKWAIQEVRGETTFELQKDINILKEIKRYRDLTDKEMKETQFFFVGLKKKKEHQDYECYYLDRFANIIANPKVIYADLSFEELSIGIPVRKDKILWRHFKNWGLKEWLKIVLPEDKIDYNKVEKISKKVLLSGKDAKIYDKKGENQELSSETLKLADYCQAITLLLKNQNQEICFSGWFESKLMTNILKEKFEKQTQIIHLLEYKLVCLSRWARLLNLTNF